MKEALIFGSLDALFQQFASFVPDVQNKANEENMVHEETKEN